MEEDYIDYLLENIESVIVILNFLSKSLENKKKKIDLETNLKIDEVLPKIKDYNSLVIENHILKQKLDSLTNYCYDGDDT